MQYVINKSHDMKHSMTESELIATGLTAEQLANFRKSGMIQGRQVNGKWTYTRHELANLLQHSPAVLVGAGEGKPEFAKKVKRFNPPTALQSAWGKVKSAITPQPRPSGKTPDELASAWNIPISILQRAAAMAGVFPADGRYTPDQVATLDNLVNGAASKSARQPQATPLARPTPGAGRFARQLATVERIEQLTAGLQTAIKSEGARIEGIRQRLASLTARIQFINQSKMN